MDLGPIIEIIAVTASVLEKFSFQLTRLFYSCLPATKRSHFKELRSRLERMPFIYMYQGHALLENLRTDYVYTHVRPVYLDTLQPDMESLNSSGRGWGDDFRLKDQRIAFDMMSLNRMCLFLGRAGSGKTTFSSYSILSIIDKLTTTGVFPFGPSDRKIPFFIPLKLVNENSPHPIFDHLCRDQRYLKSWYGPRRLINLAKKGELWLVLDGYDEVFSSTAGGSSLRLEIDSIFNNDFPPTASKRLPKIVEDFYYYLLTGNNRVWLTSRKDFYSAHRLTIEKRVQLSPRVSNWIHEQYRPAAPEPRVGEPGIASVEIAGVWERADLANKIFKRYKQKNIGAIPDLDAQTFVEFIDSHYDEDARRLSFNPLFLTAMCYVYVQSRIKGKDEPLGDTVRDLVTECVKLLIEDIDEYRVRGIEVGKELKERRALSKEKIEFLAYFASRLFANEELPGRKVFTEADLEATLATYLDKIVDENTANRIRGFGVKTFVRQLCRQGIFVIVDCTLGVISYDFPHRRFREILAVEYWDTDERFNECVSNLGEDGFFELTIAFFATSEKFRNRLLTEILRRIDRSESSEHFEKLAVACIEKVRPELVRGTIASWVELVSKEGTLDELPAGIIESFKPEQGLLVALICRFTSSIDSLEVKRAATFIVQLSPEWARQLADQVISSGSISALGILVGALVEHRPELVSGLLRKALSDSQAQTLFKLALRHFSAADRDRLREVFAHLSDNRLILLQRVAESEKARSVLSLVEEEEQERTAKAISRFLGKRFANVVRAKRRPGSDSESFAIRDKPLSVEVVFTSDFCSCPPSEVEGRCEELRILQRISEVVSGSLVVDGETVRALEQKLDRDEEIQLRKEGTQSIPDEPRAASGNDENVGGGNKTDQVQRPFYRRVIEKVMQALKSGWPMPRKKGLEQRR